MKSTYKTIDYEGLTCSTGDPFADAGGYALKEFSSHPQYKDMDILQLIMEATHIYVDRWNAKLNSFFLNSKITQSQFSNKKKIEETKKYFLSLLNETAPCIDGVCRVTGKNTKLFPACRDNSILTGSSTFVNFHHFFQEGAMLSKEAIIRIHFLPLGCEFLQGKLAIIHSNRESISAFFGMNCCKRNLSDIGYNFSKGALKSPSQSPGTALFRYLDDVNDKIELLNEHNKSSISLYLFSNFGATPGIMIYTLPFEALEFYCFIQRNEKRKKDWDALVANYYHPDKEHKKSVYNEATNSFLLNNKGDSLEFKECDFKYWSNTVYDNLIDGKSLIRYFLKRTYESSFDFEIIKKYEINLRKMKKETIAKIEQMADFILSSQDEQIIKKAISKLDNVKSSYLLRRFVIKEIVAKNYKEGNQDPMITIDDYVNYLFPDTDSWRETRDVLLIAIYQKLHEQKMSVDVDLPDDEDDYDNFKTK